MSNSVIHPIKPVFNSSSKILILGSFPSVKSREQGFYYGHPQNRFWKVIARVCNADIPTAIDEKTKLILDNGYALWDVIHSCEIDGSADSTIKNVTVNDVKSVINQSQINAIFVNGKKAMQMYKKYLEKDIAIEPVLLPSTSPANASWSEDRLFEYWNNALKNI
ncbi:MAG: DNA-deoxyinosine glycosylase [Eubacterium sp.]